MADIKVKDMYSLDETIAKELLEKCEYRNGVVSEKLDNP